MKAIEYLLQLLFPPRCPTCGDIVPIGRECAACGKALATLELGLTEMYAANAARSFEYMDGAVACYRYADSARALVHSFKFGNYPALEGQMADKMVELVREVYDGAQLSVVTCVPAFGGGFDHGARLARAMAMRIPLPFRQDLIVKTRQTAKQHELDAAARATNLQKAYYVPDDTLVRGKSVLICDDVITSGASMNECARALKNAGAAYVFGVSFTAVMPG